MPYMRDAWRKALAALADGEARAQERHGCRFAELADKDQNALLVIAMEQGTLISGERWSGSRSLKSFFERRILVDVPALYYGHPKAWNEIGFRGGPASPRAATCVSTETGSIRGKRIGGGARARGKGGKTR